MVARTAVWAFMHVLQKRFAYVALQRQLMLGKNATANGLTPAPTPHIELAPLMRGAWIVSSPLLICTVCAFVMIMMPCVNAKIGLGPGMHSGLSIPDLWGQITHFERKIGEYRCDENGHSQHVKLAPLRRGACVWSLPFLQHSLVTAQGKPSSKAPKKRRFFQLSHDGSTLRWSWNKYVVMYYVEVSSWH